MASFSYTLIPSDTEPCPPRRSHHGWVLRWVLHICSDHESERLIPMRRFLVAFLAFLTFVSACGPSERELSRWMREAQGCQILAHDDNFEGMAACWRVDYYPELANNRADEFDVVLEELANCWRERGATTNDDDFCRLQADARLGIREAPVSEDAENNNDAGEPDGEEAEERDADPGAPEPQSGTDRMCPTAGVMCVVEGVFTIPSQEFEGENKYWLNFPSEGGPVTGEGTFSIVTTVSEDEEVICVDREVFTPSFSGEFIPDIESGTGHLSGEFLIEPGTIEVVSGCENVTPGSWISEPNGTWTARFNWATGELRGEILSDAPIWEFTGKFVREE